MTVRRVASLEAIPLVTGRESTDLGAHSETVLVRVSDEDGLTGVGEADAPARIVRELVEMDDLFEWSRSLRSIVVGLDPFELAQTTPACCTGPTTTGAGGSVCTPSAPSTWPCTTSRGSSSGGRRTSSSAVPAGSRCARTQRSGPGARTDARSAR